MSSEDEPFEEPEDDEEFEDDKEEEDHEDNVDDLVSEDDDFEENEMLSKKRNRGGQLKTGPAQQKKSKVAAAPNKSKKMKASSTASKMLSNKEISIQEEESTILEDASSCNDSITKLTPQPMSTSATTQGADNEENDKNHGQAKKKKKGAISRDLKAIMRGDGPKAKILHVMYKKNRPGNVSTIENFTNHKIPKGVVQQVLEDFAKSGELKMKDNNGKNKIYWFNQDQFRSKGLNISKINIEIDHKKEELSLLENEEILLIKTLGKLESEPSDDDLENQIFELTTRKQELEQRVSTLQQTAVVLTPLQREQMRKKFLTYREAWVKRKRQCSTAIGEIADAMEKKPQQVETIIGIETDEMENVKLPPPLLSTTAMSSKKVIRKLPGPMKTK